MPDYEIGIFFLFGCDFEDGGGNSLFALETGNLAVFNLIKIGGFEDSIVIFSAYIDCIFALSAIFLSEFFCCFSLLVNINILDVKGGFRYLTARILVFSEDGFKVLEKGFNFIFLCGGH